MEGDEPGTFSEAITRNMKRGAELLDDEDEVEELEQRLAQKRRNLETQRTQQRKIQLLASLRLLGRAQAWYNLPLRREHNSTGLLCRWDKEAVHAILSCRQNLHKLPPALTEQGWSKCRDLPQTESNKFQIVLCDDLDIFVARTRRPEVANALMNKDWKQKWLNQFNPSRFLRLSIGEMLSIVRVLPELFPKVFANGRCLSKELAEAYLSHCPLNTRADTDAKAFLGALSAELKVDRDLMLMTWRRFYIMYLPDELRDSREFALTVAEQWVPNVGDLFQLFTSRVRSKYDVALAFCQGDGSSYCHVPVDARKKHRKLAEVACFKRPDLLLTTVPAIIERQLICDKDFILSLLREGGGVIPPTLFHILSPQLKQSPDIIVASIERGILRLDQVPKQLGDFVGEKLMQSTAFVLATLEGAQAKSDDVQSGDELELALKAVLLDRSMAMRALLMHSLLVADLPACWACDPSFWKTVLEISPHFWDACPFGDDINFAIAFKTPGPGLATILLGRFDSLPSNLNFWRRLDFAGLKSWFESLAGFMSGWASREILEDKDIMLSAMSIDCFVYDLLPVSLKNNRQIVEALVSTGSDRALSLMSSDARMAFPDLTIKALEMISTEDLTEILVFDFLEPNHWSNRDVARVWLSKGGPWLPDTFPDEFKEDSELMFLLAANDAEQFSVATQELRQNKSFVLRVLDENGMAYRHVDDSLLNDFDVLLAAWAHSQGVGDVFLAREQYRLVTNFASRVRAKLRDHDIFLRTILCGTHAKGSGSSPLCHLLVQLGEETSLVFRKRLAEFLGIPTGKELGKLRQASKHLELWGY